MDKKETFNKKIIQVCGFVFFLMLSFSYSDPWENVFLIISCIILLMTIREFLKEITLKKSLIFICSIIIIYLISILFLSFQNYDMKLKSEQRNNYKEEIAVLLVYMGESPMYDMSLEINNIDLKYNTLGKLTTPFILSSLKNQYREIGKSNYKSDVMTINNQLQELLPSENKVYSGFLYDRKYVEEKLIDIVNDGYHKIIVVPIFLTEGSYLEELKTRIEKMKLFNLNIQIKYTEPLWQSENIVNCYLDKIIKNVDDEKIADTGVVLIGQNEKGYNKDKYIKSVKQNLMFRNKIKDYLIDRVGYQEDKIRLGWRNSIDPEYIGEVKELLEYGVGEILCIYIKPQITFIENNKILEELKEEVDLPEGVKVKIVDGFLDDTVFLYELRNKVQIEKLKKWD
ncbi:ferrochelatase [Sporosalibacterium faouarense]|uniref:ferrochelatase n=1 Tax=Sporosalibacterium faouarense TaxID=516123 RepID=UPI00141CBC8F|nr:ferrochelatase [Sporosalibacterium faouarense]MTI49056.1 ferrochelatase [Bacillota bacterium]